MTEGTNKLTPSDSPSAAAPGYALGDRRYFHAEVVRFRSLMGQRTFWRDVERARRALGGLFYVWINTESPTASDGDLIHSTTDEFERRAMLMALA